MSEEETMDFMLMLEVLADQGVRKISIEFDGGGDSGEVLPPVYADGQGHVIESKLIKEVDTMDIVTFCEDKLLDQVGDWYNGDGGYGEICIDVPEGTYTIESHIRFTSTEDYDYEGKLQDYFKEEDD